MACPSMKMSRVNSGQGGHANWSRSVPMDHLRSRQRFFVAVAFRHRVPVPSGTLSSPFASFALFCTGSRRWGRGRRRRQGYRWHVCGWATRQRDASQTRDQLYVQAQHPRAVTLPQVFLFFLSFFPFFFFSFFFLNFLSWITFRESFSSHATFGVHNTNTNTIYEEDCDFYSILKRRRRVYYFSVKPCLLYTGTARSRQVA